MQLVFASANEHKIKEIKAMLPARFHVAGLAETGITEEIPETGATIKDNSLLKATYVANHLRQQNKHLAVFADDSGLEVDALGGAPGVYSARYAGIPKNDAANNVKLLKELSGAATRKARFVTIITLLVNDQTFYFEGWVDGTIGSEPRGNSGFGYDPLFIPTGFDQTFAELGAAVKNSISHRAMAVNKFVAYLSTL